MSMKRAMLTALAVGVTSLSAGCYLVYDDDDRFRGFGEMTISFTFDGVSCDLADVARIRITLEGQTRGDDFTETVGCGSFRDGVTVFDLLSDDYEVTVEGLASDDSVLYSMEQPILVSVFRNDESFVSVDLTSSTGVLALNWNFPAGASCAEVAFVDVTLRDPAGAVYDAARYPCTFGGVQYDRLAAGVWTVEMTALDEADVVLFRLEERTVEIFERSFNEYNLLLGD